MARIQIEPYLRDPGVPIWRRYHVEVVMVAAVKYWSVNGALGAALPAALTQDVQLDDLPPHYCVLAQRQKSAVAVTGPTTCTSEVGTGTTGALFSNVNAYDLMAVVADANIVADPTDILAHAATDDNDTLITSITATVANIDTINVGAAFDVWILGCVLFAQE